MHIQAFFQHVLLLAEQDRPPDTRLKTTVLGLISGNLDGTQDYADTKCDSATDVLIKFPTLEIAAFRGSFRSIRCM